MIRPAAQTEHVDVLIVGAGLSGIGAAYHLQKRCPGRTYAILEARGATLGHAFKPWTNAKAIADGPSILAFTSESERKKCRDEARR